MNILCQTHTQKPIFPLAVLLALCLPAAAHAQSNEPKEAKVEAMQTKDDAVTINELRIRGEAKRTTVKPKNAPEYQIEPDTARKAIDDKSQGKASWKLFSF